MKKIKIEVVIPVYNAERFVREGVESVLAQSEGLIEKIWLINDGSQDNTRGVLDRLQGEHALIRVIDQGNRGVSAALNRGISNVKADWIAFLDADDLWLAGKLKVQLDVIKAHPEIQAVFGQIIEFEDFPIGETRLYKARESVGEWLSRSTFLCKKSLFDQFGLFDEQLKVGEFVDWFHKVRNSGVPYHVVQQVLAKRRIHGANLTIKVDKQDYLSLIRKQIESRRKDAN
jgi:glycosyltransferase involved in cell wall biosynthesis